MKTKNSYDRLEIDINQLFDTKLDIEVKRYPTYLKKLFTQLLTLLFHILNMNMLLLIKTTG